MLIETRKERSILREIEEMFGVKGRCLCADGAQASCEFDDCPRLRLEAEAVQQGDTGQLETAILAAISDVPSAEIR